MVLKDSHKASASGAAPGADAHSVPEGEPALRQPDQYMIGPNWPGLA